MSGAWVTLHSESCLFRWSLKLDANGTVALDPAPPMACQVLYKGHKVLGRVEIPARGGQGMIELHAKQP